jgi:Tol biopolymer transport system component
LGFVHTPALAFSPDGAQLLLFANALHSDGEQAWLMSHPPHDARPPFRIFSDLPAFVITPTFSWLPDNRHVVVSASERGAPHRLYLADTTFGTFRALSSGTTRQLAPSVSPDGTKLVFTEAIEDYDVVTLDLSSGAVAPLIATSRIEQMPAWAANGSALVYVTDRAGHNEIWLREQGRQDRALVTESDFPPGTTWSFMAPALSPDGARVIYLRIERDAAGASGGSQLWMSAVAGGPPIPLTAGSVLSEHAGSWSPDGSWYVYVGGGPPAWTLNRVRTLGHMQPEVIAPVTRAFDSVPVWSPAGDWILHDDDGMKLIAVDGGTTRDLGLRDAACAFVRGAELLYCIKDLEQAPSLIAVDFEGRVVRTFGPVPTEHAPRARMRPSVRLTLNPDGTGLTYSVAKTDLKLWLIEGLDTVALP